MTKYRRLGFKVEGARELIRDFNKAALLQQTSVTKAAKAGARIALVSAKSNAPEETGALKQGLMLKAEKSRVAKSGKKVYQVTFDPSMNDEFVKISKDGKRSYYPASMEYGYRLRNGGYVPGFHYLRDALVDNKDLIEQTVIGVMWSEINKILKKRGK